MLPAIDFISSVDIPQLFVLHKTWPVSSVQWMMSSEHFVANYYICDQLLFHLWSVTFSYYLCLKGNEKPATTDWFKNNKRDITQNK